MSVFNKTAYPNLSDKQLNKIKNKYLSGIAHAIAESERTFPWGHEYYQTYSDTDVYALSANDLKLSMGEIHPNKTRYYIWSYVQRKTPFLDELLKGNSNQGVLGAYRINNKLMGEFMDYIDESSILKEHLRMDANMPPQHIDVESLRYLKEILIEDYAKETNDYTKKRIKRNLTYLGLVLGAVNKEGLMLRGFDPTTETPRLYLKGINLQSAPKMIRSVALGEHYIYDFNASCFGVFVSLFFNLIKNYDHPLSEAENSTILLRDYLSNKDYYRGMITKDIYTDLAILSPEKLKRTYQYDNVKKAITAIGFRAKNIAHWMPGKKQGAFLTIFKDKDLTTKFIDNHYVGKMTDEFKMVTDAVLADEELKDPELNILSDMPFNGKNADAVKLAHIYQSYEFKLLSGLMKIAGDNCILPLHDGIATKHKIGNDALNTYKWKIQQTLPFVKLDKAEYKGRFVDQSKPPELLEEEEMTLAHKIHMKQEMIDAEAYAKAVGNNWSIKVIPTRPDYNLQWEIEKIEAEKRWAEEERRFNSEQ